ncbi:MAG: hypothetical protein ACSHWS_00705 [Sulfitobacter sp.]
MKKITVAKNEHGKSRVFALSMSDADAKALLANDVATAGGIRPQEQALGVNSIDPKYVEVFRVADLGALGLAGYLREGIDADAGDIARDAEKLGAVDGWVMLVHSSAFGGNEVTLDPIPDLTLIGTYDQEQADSTTIPLESEASAPYTGVPGAIPPVAPKGRAGGSLVVVGLAVLAALILWWAFS